jgi:hypothetical protein
MGDYISRQSLIDACNAYSESPWANDYGAYSEGVRDAMEALRDCAQAESEDATIGIGFPSADVVEVVHGEWIQMNGHRYCNVCGHKDSPILTKYCPNCGARMDGE